MTERQRIVDEKRLYTQDEVCEIFGISRSGLYKWRKAGKINALKIGHHVRFTQEEIDRLIEQGKEG